MTSIWICILKAKARYWLLNAYEGIAILMLLGIYVVSGSLTILDRYDLPQRTFLRVSFEITKHNDPNGH